MFKIVNNAQLEIVDIPETVIYPRNQRILVVKENPKLPYTVIANLKKICPSCEIVAFNKSSELTIIVFIARSMVKFRIISRMHQHCRS